MKSSRFMLCAAIIVASCLIPQPRVNAWDIELKGRDAEIAAMIAGSAIGTIAILGIVLIVQSYRLAEANAALAEANAIIASGRLA